MLSYWQGVANSDRSEIKVAVTKVSTLTAAAGREEKEPGEGRRRTKGLRNG
jgi:hypothetical protein